MQSKTNRKVVFTGPQAVEIQHENVNGEALGPDELLIESMYSVVSAGTELACLSGGESWFSFPRVPGYASVGRIVALGDGVTGFREGQVVLHYGGHQAYNLRKQGDLILPVPDGIDGKVAPLTRLATVAFTSVRVSGIEAGDFVAVAGLGPVGNLAAQLAQAQGGRVIGVDMSAGRVDLARNCGIELTIDASKEDAAARIEEMTGGMGVETVIDATGNPRAIVAEMDWVAKRGQLILLGSPRGEVQGDITDLLNHVHLWPHGCVTLKGAHEWRYPVLHDPNVKHSLERNSRVVWWLQQSGKLQMHKLITHVVKPDDAPAVYKGLQKRKDEYVGVVYDWS
jgi:2-desacetyl-2-hydroxyethyl bacteriochlorophyllide A dehydrogenase